MNKAKTEKIESEKIESEKIESEKIESEKTINPTSINPIKTTKTHLYKCNLTKDALIIVKDCYNEFLNSIDKNVLIVADKNRFNTLLNGYIGQGKNPIRNLIWSIVTVLSEDFGFKRRPVGEEMHHDRKRCKYDKSENRFIFDFRNKNSFVNWSISDNLNLNSENTLIS